MIASPCCVLLLALTQAQEPPSAQTPAPEDAGALTARILERKDEVEPELIRRLANLRTPEALDGLLASYDALASLYLRLIVVRSLSLFDGVEGLEARALQKLTDLATLSQEAELREAAVDAIADCPGSGKAYLALLVGSGADASIRERALRLHLATRRPEDADWYRSIWRPGEKAAQEKGRKKKDAAAAPEPEFTPALRELAFEGLASTLAVDELVEATEAKLPEVRRLALEELSSRPDARALEAAEKRYQSNGERPGTRVIAARMLLSDRGPRYGERLFKDATRVDVPLELAFGIADLLVALRDPKIDALALKSLGDGKASEKLFTMRIASALEDPRVDKALLELSEDRDQAVVLEAISTMGKRANPSFAPRLEELLAQSEDERVLAAAIDALGVLQGSDAAWQERLLPLARSERELLRNAALQAMGRTRDERFLPSLMAALDHDVWSTRLAAARAIEELRAVEGIGGLVQRLGKEEGRVRVEFSDIMWRLTGLPFRSDPAQWKRWWETEGASFQIPSAEEVRKRERAMEERRLKQVTKTSTFFGVRVISHRVCFVIDISGSMEEPLGGGGQERGETRLQAAKRELIACLEALEPGTFFNLVPFSDGVSAWKPRAHEFTSATLTEAKEFVDRLGARGGTNIHGGLRTAFEDSNVDTIYFLSDGEPSVGEIIDPLGIRLAVESWNEHRGIEIHTIALGDRFPLLEWLAEDSGGTYTSFP